MMNRRGIEPARRSVHYRPLGGDAALSAPAVGATSAAAMEESETPLGLAEERPELVPSDP